MKRWQLILLGLTGLIVILALTKTGTKLITTGGQIVSETWKTITDIGTNLVAQLEGFKDTVYQDIAGIWTIGFGHKVKPGENFYPYGPVHTISADDAKTLLTSDMQQAADVVNKYVTVPLTETQFNSLVSFVFNTASTDENIFANSTLLKKLNSGDYQGAADELDKWIYVHQNGKVVQSNGLIARREAEKNLFLS